MNHISVVVPAFNAERTLKETLHSISTQTYPAAEIIVVDDGSTDETADIAEAVSGVRVLRQENAGTGSALNAGLRAARHSHIALVDADDVWESRCLEVHMSHFKRQPQIEISVGWVSEFICPTLSHEDAVRFQPRHSQVGWLSGATLFNRQCFEKVGKFNSTLRSRAWIDWMARARHLGMCIGVVNEVILRRRLHPNSLSVSARAQGNAGLLDTVRMALSRRRGHEHE